MITIFTITPPGAVPERTQAGRVCDARPRFRFPSSLATTNSCSGQKKLLEKLWRDFFSDPSQWWDHRSEKLNVKYPDFTHKKTKAALWHDHSSNPAWVEAALDAMIPGTVQLDLFSWNRRLAKFVKAGEYEKAIALFQQMEEQGMSPESFTFIPVLKACASLQALEEGRKIHLQIIQSGCESDLYVGSSLVDMYAKCGSIEDAWAVFNNMSMHDVVTWTAMIVGYVKCGNGQKALELSHRMQQEGMEPNHVTFIAVLNACASVGEIEAGRRVHEQIILRGWESDVVVGSSLVDMYAKCGCIDDAWTLFNRMPTRNVVSWNAMIQGYVKCGQGQKALELVQTMQHAGVTPDSVTFMGLVNACASTGALQRGRDLHNQIIQSGFESDILVCNCLIDMYTKCGDLEDAQRVFNKMPTRCLVSWNAMILGHVKCGQGQEALDLYGEMQCEGLQPDTITFVGLLNACASLAALEKGQAVYKEIIQCGYESDTFVSNSLIDMYSKCGSIEDAQRVFNRMSKPSVISWNAMLAGYAIHGHANEAIKHFEQMWKEGVEMDTVTFVCLLSACSHAGLLDQGLHYFESMSSKYNVSTGLEHYACLVDLLGRAGQLHEAKDALEMTSCEADLTLWMSLLAACRTYGDVEMGEEIAKKVFEVDPGHSSGYVLLSNIYAAAGKWDNKSNMQWQRLKGL